MHEDCYFCIKRNICTKDVPKPCRYRYTEEERIADQAADRVGVILNATYLPDTYYKKEDNEMKKATSVQNIKNVKGVSFLIENHPMEQESKLTIVASTDDDIFEFEFEGPDLLQSCRTAGLFTVLEKDRKIKELKEESMLLKEENKHLRKDIMRAKDELHSIKQEKSNLSEPTSRRDILKAAEMCVCGQREQDYGTPESNFQLIADLWNDYLKKEKSSIVVDSMDVAMMMALLKIARIKNGGGSGDSFVDLAGYAACGGEIWYDGEKQVPEGE